MNETAYKKLSLLIKKYCPDFIEEKYPKFIAFLQAYYDWSMMGFNPGKVVSSLIDWGDIDETIDQFIDYFKQEYLDGVNLDFSGDITTFIKHSKEFYSSRGTPESFRFLLRLLSGNPGRIYYPGRYLMKSSDGLWGQRHAIFVRYSDTFKDEFRSTKIRLVPSANEVTLEDYEVHFDNNTRGQILKIYVNGPKDVLENSHDQSVEIDFEGETYTYEILSTISQLEIIDGGNNYKVDDRVILDGDLSFVARVSSVSYGKVDSYAILDGGTNYNVGDPVYFTIGATADYYGSPMIYVDEVDPDTGAITSLDIRYPGYGLYEVPEFTEVSSITGSGADIQFISDKAGTINEIEVVNAEIGYLPTDIPEVVSDTGVGASLALRIGPIFNYIPAYIEDGSFLSDVFKLQDSDYWQDYSYEIQSSLTLDTDVVGQFSEYKDIFKRLVHPVGFKLFNSFALSNHIEMLMKYVNSEFVVNPPHTFLEFVSILEMISEYNRIIDNEIIFQHRFSTLEEEQNTPIGFYKREGGEYVHSNISST